MRYSQITSLVSHDEMTQLMSVDPSDVDTSLVQMHLTSLMPQPALLAASCRHFFTQAGRESRDIAAGLMPERPLQPTYLASVVGCEKAIIPRLLCFMGHSPNYKPRAVHFSRDEKGLAGLSLSVLCHHHEEPFQCEALRGPLQARFEASSS